MFYVACELRDRPDLKEENVCVGGKNMVSCSSYKARKFGVRSAMPLFIAKQLCPSLKVLDINMDLYRQCSQLMLDALRPYDIHLDQRGLDEVSLDITSFLHRNDISIHDHQAIFALAQNMQQQISL